MSKNALVLVRRAVSKVKASVDAKTAKVAVAVGSFVSAGSSFAADGGIDTTEALAGIAAGVAAALLVSAAMTGGRISVKASKLPRSGA